MHFCIALGTLPVSYWETKQLEIGELFSVIGRVSGPVFAIYYEYSRLAISGKTPN